jgi:hypothetical protein
MRFPANLPARVGLQQSFYAAPHQIMIVSYKNTKILHLSLLLPETFRNTSTGRPTPAWKPLKLYRTFSNLKPNLCPSVERRLGAPKT